MVQINDHYYEDLTAERMTALLDALRAGADVTIGSQEPQRQYAAPIGGPTTLVATGEG